jgi:amino acid adenylation domain-containing protein
MHELKFATLERPLGVSAQLRHDVGSINRCFEAQHRKNPDALAVIADGEGLTYGELEARANRLAHYLRGFGVGPDVVVGVCMEKSANVIVAFLGCLKAGGAYLPLDPEYPESRLAFMLEDCAVRVVVTSAALKAKFDGARVNLAAMDELTPTLAAYASTAPVSEEITDGLAYVIYTSGSTGKAKGVGVSHGAVVRLVTEARYAKLDTSAAVLQLGPLTFDAATFEVWGPLLNGGRVIMASRDVALAPHKLEALLRTSHANQLFMTPALFNRLVTEAPSVFASLERVLIGGESADVKSVRTFVSRGMAPILVNAYGPTESTTFATSYEVREVAVGAGSIPIGRPIGNTQVYVLDEEMEPVPVGVAGELYIGGDGLARGYIGQAGLTAQRFVANPFTQGKRLYRTGDRVRWRAGGELEFLGRMDEQVKIRGYRIEPAEVEAALLKHEQVKQALVMVREDEPGEKSLVGYVATGEGTSIEITQVREHLKQQLPAYLIPSAWVVLENLPLTENGKIDRNALPAPLKRAEASGYVAPRTPIEKAMAEIWMKILQVEQVGINDNFFDLGGHSLKAMRVITEVRDIFGVEMEPRTVFDAPTIVALCDWILNLLIDLANNQVR